MISVVISAQSEKTICPELLKSLDSQSISHEIIINLNRELPDRGKAIPTAKYNFVLFLDQDCEIPNKDYLQNIWDYFSSNSEVDVLAGYYESPPGANSIARSYNKLCKMWAHAGDTPNLLGGCFAVRNPKRFQDSVWQVNAWGGEDALIGLRLKASGTILASEPWFWVYHHDQGNSIKFIKRAWIHGRARSSFKLKNTKRSRYFLQHFPELKVFEILIIGIHMLVVGLGSACNGLTAPHTSPKK